MVATCAAVLASLDGRIAALEQGYERIRDASDVEMRDGDLARDIAESVLNKEST